MILFKKRNSLRNWLDIQQQNKKSIGFVPTMGALHDGHLSLVRKSRAQNEITVSSLFVNPTQFNDPKDYEAYPLSPEKDIDMLEEAGCDVIFFPSVKEMYPEGSSGQPARKYDLGWIETILEGKFRPGHYQGVCIIVDKLLDSVQPDRLYLGQKDYQQCLVLKKMLGLTGREQKTEIVICPTLREESGLAMSSRNRRLTPEQLKKSTILFKTLNWIGENLSAGKNTGGLIDAAIKKLEGAGMKPEYVEIARAADLQHVDTWNGIDDLAILAAAWMDEVRLIDNIQVKTMR